MNRAARDRPLYMSDEIDTTAGIEGPEWSALAELWAQTWASFADPARRVVADATAIGAGTRVLDLGCGSGEFLAMASARGAEVSGTDAAEGMIAIARGRLPGADLRVGPIERLAWPDDSFDVVTAFNSVQFAADRRATLAEARRVARPGGLVAVCAWAADRDCEVQLVCNELERLAAEPPGPGGPRLGEPGILDELSAAVGLEVLSTQNVSVPYTAADDDALQRAFLLDAVLSGALEHVGEEASRATIAQAAEPYRRPDGSYRFENVFRVLIARA
jgi:SAM-dependent methyltransferase